MSLDLSVLGHIRALLHLPSQLDKVKANILKAEQNTSNHIGTWKCICGHKNAIHHHPHPALHPLGFMSCRVCSLTWHPDIKPEITSQTTDMLVPKLQRTLSDHTCVLRIPPYSDSSYAYICLDPGCGLTWRTGFKKEWFSGRRRHVLLVNGKRGKCHCKCGTKIYQAGEYAVAEIV